MFKTFQGVTEDAKNVVYLRPETAQGIFVNFKNVQRTSRKKVPFGIGQVGKSFRNEITPGNFTFRTREFEQMELEFFCKPGTDLEWFDYWRSYCINWLTSLGIREDQMRLRDHDKEELSFYSNATTDIEFLFPFGWGELWGIADRTDYDLNRHQEVSGQDLTYFDDETSERYIPYVIEPSLGADRVTLAFLCAAYDEEILEGGESRTVLRFHPALAPVKIGILPLSKKLNEGALKISEELSKYYNVEFEVPNKNNQSVDVLAGYMLAGSLGAFAAVNKPCYLILRKKGQENFTEPTKYVICGKKSIESMYNLLIFFKEKGYIE